MDRRGEPDQQDFANSREQYPVQPLQRMREGVSADEHDEPGGGRLAGNGKRPTHPSPAPVRRSTTRAGCYRARDRQDGSLEWDSRSSRELVAAAGGRVQARRGRLQPPGATKACAACQANHARRWSSIRCKNSPLLFSCKSVHSCAVPPGKRGGSRSSRTRGGMRWTREARKTKAPDAYGEVVWS